MQRRQSAPSEGGHLNATERAKDISNVLSILSPYKQRREVVPVMNTLNLITQVVGMVCRVISAICSVMTYLKQSKKK
ncbi:MAG TPA: hypothetical protein DDW30_06630 [Clostridiales bacterium]|nr:hypothetical protein [Clostridiales bacterium]